MPMLGRSRCRLAGGVALVVPSLVACRPTGLFLVGGSRGQQLVETPPVLEFGTNYAATVVTVANGGLEVVRNGAPELYVGDDVVSLPRVRSPELSVDSWSVGGVAQWALWSLDTFDSADTGAWSANDRSFCGVSTDKFLGGPCRFGATSTMRRYENLPPHKEVRIRARVHYFDDWQGENVALQVDGETVWAQEHAWCPGFLTWMCVKFGINTCGHDTPDRMSVKAEATVPHTSHVLDLAFASSLALGSDPCKASWGIDDVTVEML